MGTWTSSTAMSLSKENPVSTEQSVVKNIILDLLSKYEIKGDPNENKEIINEGIRYVLEMDAERQQIAIESLTESLESDRKNKPYEIWIYSRIIKSIWWDWREKTQRNYDPAPEVVPEIPLGNEPGFYAPGPYQHNPEITTETESNGNIIKYKFTNRQTIQKRMVIISHKKNDLLREELSNNIKSLQTHGFDYRYPYKSLIIASKQSLTGEWYCDKCCLRNKGSWDSKTDQFCEQCGSERTMNIPKDYQKDYKEIMEYNDKQFIKWKMRIQDVLDPLLNSKQYWIPSIFHIDMNGIVNIKSEIHNLPRFKYNKLYSIISKIFAEMVPMFEWILGDISLKDRDLPVIVGMQDYQLYPQQIFNGALHREGYKYEGIEGAGIYYFDKSNCFEDDLF
eukprot:349047_1